MVLGDFSAQAQAYAGARPGYPGALLDELVELAGLHPVDPVADLGAGTGILARELAARGLAVTAVEPNEAMRAAAAPDPRIRWVAGRFEATGLADGSQAWTVAAQAFHWARPAEALPEIARVLRPGACFTTLWNDRETERSNLLGAVRAILEREVPGWDERYRVADWSGVLTSTGDFEEVVVSSARHVVAMSAERFVALWRSQNRLAELAGPERLTRVIAAIEGAVREQGAMIELPYVCRAYTARCDGTRYLSA